MARTDATILAKQKAGSKVNDFVPVYYYTSGRPSDGAGSWARIDNLSSVDRIVYIDPLFWAPYDAQATIYLNNADSAFDAYDLREKWIRIGLGIDTDVSYPPYFKVVDHGFLSLDKKVAEQNNVPQDQYVLYCVGAPNLLERYIVNNTTAEMQGCYYFNQPDLDATLDNKTTRQILDFLLGLAGLDLGADIDRSGVDVDVDTYVGVWKPPITIYPNTNLLEDIDELLAPYLVSLLSRTDCMHLLSGQTDASNFTYVIPSDGSNQTFKSGNLLEKSFKPRKVIVESYDGSLEGSYTDSSWTSDMGAMRYRDQYNVATTVDELNAIAEAYVKRAKARASGGEYTLWIADRLRELYDPVTFTDGRGNTSGNGIVGLLDCPYYPGEPWRMTLRIGGIQKALPSDMQGIVDRLATGINGGLSGQLLQPGSISPELLRQAMRRHTNNITWTSTAYNSVTFAPSTPSVVFEDGSSLTLTNSGSPKTLTGTHYAYFIQGNTTIQWTTDPDDTIGPDRGLLAVCAIGATTDSKAFVQPSDGKVGIVNSIVVAANSILASHLVATLILATTIYVGGSGHLKLSGDGIELEDVTGTTDDLYTNAALADSTIVTDTYTFDKGKYLIIFVEDTNNVVINTEIHIQLRFTDADGNQVAKSQGPAAASITVYTGDPSGSSTPTLTWYCWNNTGGNASVDINLRYTEIF